MFCMALADGGATLFCVGPYHEALSEAQRLHPTTDITGTADDTYACDACSPSADGGTPELFTFYIVHLLATESTGALSPDVIRLLRELAKTAQGTSGHDSTVYGLSRASPKSFFPHHLAAISSAIVCADARSIRNHAASLATQLSHGMI